MKTKLYNIKIVRFIIIPFLLFAFWLFFTLLYIINFDTSFSIWSYNHSHTDFTTLSFDKLHRGDSLAGDFIARDKNLGIIALRFQTYIRPPYKYEDQFLFRFREKGSSKWYYENIYRSGLIYDVPFFPFGFPPIENSKGKHYEFEIVSLNGGNINAMSISKRQPILVTKYKYSRAELTSDKNVFSQFFAKKFYNAMLTPEVWFSSLIYLQPLTFYIIWITFISKYRKPIKRGSTLLLSKIKSHRHYKYISPFVRLFEIIFINNFDLVIISLVLVDVFLIQLTNDIIYVMVLFLWVVTQDKYRKSSKNSVVVGLCLLALPPLLLQYGKEPTAEKSAVWAYIFLTSGTIQIFFDLRKSNYSKPFRSE
jgi:hypothetical protein